MQYLIYLYLQAQFRKGKVAKFSENSTKKKEVNLENELNLACLENFFQLLFDVTRKLFSLY